MDTTVYSDYIQSITDLSDGVRVAAGTEANRLLTNLIGWDDRSVGDLENHNALCIRVSNLASLSYSLSEFEPASSQEAQQALDAALVLFDDAIIDTSDAGFDDTSAALRNLKSYVVEYLQTLVSTQPQLIEVDLVTSMPSLVAAYSLYRDATRADELTRENDPLCDLFLPKMITALSN